MRYLRITCFNYVDYLWRLEVGSLKKVRATASARPECFASLRAKRIEGCTAKFAWFDTIFA
jgi:hypothetical protein